VLIIRAQTEQAGNIPSEYRGDSTLFILDRDLIARPTFLLARYPFNGI